SVSSLADGALLLGASSLTGRCWLGSIWVFKDPKEAPNEGFCSAGVQTEAGVADVKWVSEKGILVASDSGAVEMWELAEDETLIVSKFCRHEHDDIVTSISPMAREGHAVSGSMDCWIKVWDLAQESVLNMYNARALMCVCVSFPPAHSSPISCVSCSPTEEALFLSSGQDGRLLLWDRRKPKPASRLDIGSSPSCPTSIAWHPQKSSVFAYGDDTGRVVVRELQGGDSTRTADAHTRRVTGLAFSSHSTPLLASISDDCSVAVMDADLKEIFRDRRHQDFVRGISWAPDGSSTLTTAGWDHQILHHTMQTAEKSPPAAAAASPTSP
ncbi:MEP50 protein, partial [Amia calva]|nr:MEP50 protein [Amia calva]